MLRFCALLLIAVNASADTLETVGVSLLRAFDPALTGAGVPMAMVEAKLPDPAGWEVNPAAIGQPASFFTWHSTEGTASTFPNLLGAESWHANSVASVFLGVAPGVPHMDNYEAGFFSAELVPAQTAFGAKVVNQSFTYTSQVPTVDRDYDDYAARFNVLFVTGAGNEGPVKSSGTAYNGLAVAAQGGMSSIGPTTDGRSKPELTVPSGFTSFSTPVVSGAAALLLQAGGRGDGGANTALLASDIRLLKALLLNGAQKPADWTNASPAGLDHRHGAGVLNVFESWRQLRGGRVVPGSAEVTARRGWDVSAITSSISQAGTRDYHFDVQGASNRVFTFTATLAWNRQHGETLVNNLDLLLFHGTTGTLVAERRSTLDNIEHLHVTNLPPGKYELQVWKAGGPLRVSDEETYALAFNFGPSEPARLGGVSLNGGQIHCTIQGEPGTAYRLEATLDFVTWFTLGTNVTSASGTAPVAVSAEGSRAFLRALELP